MKKIIEVFVRNQKAVVESECVVPRETAHPCSGTTTTVAYNEERILPEADQQALELARAVAEENDLKVKVYNLSTSFGSFKALIKGVRRTPTVIVGNERIEGTITKQSLLKALESQMHCDRQNVS